MTVAYGDTARHEPEPEPALELLRRLGAQGGVGVGDLPSDIVAMKAAGLRTIGVTWGYGAAPSLWSAGSDNVVDSIGELREELGHLAFV